ncbi:MAG: DUF4442 domain-containing protein [Planctomycetota bacterium]
MNCYPPLLFAAVRWESVADDFLEARVLVKRRLINRNLNGTIFGGALSAAADPVFAVLLWQALASRGRSVEGWTARSQVEFVRPGRSHLRLHFRVEPMELERIERDLDAEGRSELESVVEAIDREGEVCARFEISTVMRDPAVRRALAAQANQ